MYISLSLLADKLSWHFRKTFKFENSGHKMHQSRMIICDDTQNCRADEEINKIIIRQSHQVTYIVKQRYHLCVKLQALPFFLELTRRLWIKQDQPCIFSVTRKLLYLWGRILDSINKLILLAGCVSLNRCSRKELALRSRRTYREWTLKIGGKRPGFLHSSHYFISLHSSLLSCWF